MSVYFKESEAIGYLTFDQPDSKVNVLNSTTLVALDKILDEIKNKPLKALVILSAKKDIFIAGADIKEIENIVEEADGKKKAQAGQFVFNKLEDLPYPTIAVIEGAALGGGCELALACRYRIATFNERIRIGLPEVNLGFVPGFGGTYRLPKVVGLLQAIKLITSGNPIASTAAFKCGLVDRLYPQVSIEANIQEFLKEILQNPEHRIFKGPQPKGFDAFLQKNPFGQSILYRQTNQAVVRATKGFYPAPLKAVEVIRKTAYLKREQALDIESTAFAQLAITSTSKSLVKVFFLTEKFKKLTIPGTEAIKPAPITKGGVLGAGIMGGGIAQLLSGRGVWVRLKDINWDAIAKGLKAAYDVNQSAVKRRRMKPHELTAKMAMISGSINYEGFHNCDIVIEAVVENIDVKKKVFAELAANVSPKTILASNTSSLSVTEMGKAVPDPTKIIGFHFFNPVHRMPLIEIITTPQTSTETLVTTLEFAKKLGKMPIIVKDAPGFLVNRVLLGYINEASRILEEGGSIEAIDKIVTDFGLPMGPFTLSDEVGLDVGVKVLHILEAGLGARFKTTTIFNQISELKLLGKKAGKGFYIHGKTQRTVNPQVQSMVKGGRWVGEKEALERMIYVMVNEAAMILEEGVVDSADAVDLGMIMGTGFPPFHGGLLRYADKVGLKNIVDRLNEWSAKPNGERFKPSKYLQQLASSNKGFHG